MLTPHSSVMYSCHILIHYYYQVHTLGQSDFLIIIQDYYIYIALMGKSSIYLAKLLIILLVQINKSVIYLVHANK